MRFDWDDSKSDVKKKKRGYNLEEIANIFRSHYVERIKNDAPEQFIAIGYLKNILFSVIYEIRYDEERRIYLVNYLLEKYQKGETNL